LQGEVKKPYYYYYHYYYYYYYNPYRIGSMDGGLTLGEK